MNRYYINRGPFANQYNLCYAPADQKLPYPWERITRKEATRYAAEEADRRKYNQAMSGYAPQYVLPYDMDEIDLRERFFPEDYTIRDRIVTF